MNKNKVSIRDIAASCDVSPATVSLVINNHPKISDVTRNKVLQKIKEMDYYPNVIAQRLSRRITKTVAVVIPKIDHIFYDFYFAQTVSGVYDAALKFDYEILLQVASEDFVLSKKYIRLFKEGRIDGMLCIGSTFDDTYLKEFENSTYPFILVNSYFKRSNVSYIKGDAVRGGYLATKHLVELGHKDILFLSGSWNVSTTVDKFNGYKKALKEAGIEFKEEYVITGDFTKLGGEKAVEVIKERGLLKKVSSIFCNNDLMASGFTDAIKDLGMTVPDDISVVGFDNSPISDLHSPKITTVDMNVYDIAFESCNYIINSLINKSQYKPIKKVFSSKLIIKESTAIKNRK